jgi:hypothetical protein
MNITDPLTLKGEHWSRNTNNDVQRLEIVNCDFVTFPKNLHELFPNLIRLYIEVLVISNKFEHHQLQQKAFEIIRTKIFPDRKLSDELMKQPEKLRSIIMTKRRLEEELNNL